MNLPLPHPIPHSISRLEWLSLIIKRKLVSRAISALARPVPTSFERRLW